MNIKFFTLVMATLLNLNALATLAPDFTLKASDGNHYSLKDFKGKLVVLEWFNHGCPFVRKHYDSQNMQRLQKIYASKGVIWLTIISSAPGKQGHTNVSEAMEVRKNEGMNSLASLLDSDGKVGILYQAKTTPHMFIIGKDSKLLYEGAIDNRPSTKASDIANSVNYIRENLNLLLQSKDVKYVKTTPYGCSVKY